MLFQTVVPMFPLVFFFGGAAAGILFARDATLDLAGLRERGFSIAAIAMIVPIGLLFLVSLFSDTRLFLHRYLTPAIPGLCMVWGALIASLRPGRIASSAAIGALLLVGGEGIYNLNREHHNEDWRGAMRRARKLGGEGRPGLAVYSGFVESRSVAMLRNERQRAQILSPVAAYPAGFERVTPIPYDVGPEAIAYWDAALKSELGEVSNLIVVLRGSHGSGDWESHLQRTLPGSGFQHVRKEVYGSPKGVVLLQYKRA
jgi:hypothetical protein